MVLYRCRRIRPMSSWRSQGRIPRLAMGSDLCIALPPRLRDPPCNDAGRAVSEQHHPMLAAAAEETLEKR
jgi:hypothetical protein